MKLKYIVVYENSSDELDIEHHRIKVKVTASEGCIFAGQRSCTVCYLYNSLVSQADLTSKGYHSLVPGLI